MREIIKQLREKLNALGPSWNLFGGVDTLKALVDKIENEFIQSEEEKSSLRYQLKTLNATSRHLIALRDERIGALEKEGLSPKAIEPTTQQEKERAEIEGLLLAMYTIQDSLEPNLRSNEISWANDLYDNVKIGFLKQIPDSSYQDELTQQKFSMEFIDAKRSLLDRMKKLIEDAEDELWADEASEEAENQTRDHCLYKQDDIYHKE